MMRYGITLGVIAMTAACGDHGLGVGEIRFSLKPTTGASLSSFDVDSEQARAIERASGRVDIEARADRGSIVATGLPVLDRRGYDAILGFASSARASLPSDEGIDLSELEWISVGRLIEDATAGGLARKVSSYESAGHAIGACRAARIALTWTSTPASTLEADVLSGTAADSESLDAPPPPATGGHVHGA